MSEAFLVDVSIFRTFSIVPPKHFNLNHRNLITELIAFFRPLVFSVTAGEWDKTVDEGTEQTRNIAEIIRVVYYMPFWLL